MEDNMNHNLLTVDEAAEYLRLCPRTVYRYCSLGIIKAIQFTPGGTWRIPRESIMSSEERERDDVIKGAVQ